MFENAKKFWQDLSERARMSLAVGIVIVLTLAIGLSVWAMRGREEVLFADLKPQDAATLVAELEKQKIPYRLADGGSKILVDEGVVYKTRLKLMGKGMPLQGGVGFEIFDNADFGMTEFAQKINFQRALQGELARTIMAFDEVKFARVHLVMPENSIFKQNKSVTKASVTLVMKEGREVAPDQVLGIQRLVGAAVSGLDASKVTVLDQRGVVLSRMSDADDQYAASGRLQKKKEVELYLTHKLMEVLDRTFGAGQAVVSIDVTLNLDEVKTTQEDVVPAANSRGEATGVVTRKRLVSQGGRMPVADGDYNDRGLTTTEIEYQVGRKVQQIVETPGTVRRLSVGVLIPEQLDEAKLNQLREVIAATVGLNSVRGDVIAVQSLAQFEQKTHRETTGAPIGAASPPPASTSWWRATLRQPLLLTLVLTSLMVLVLVGMLIRRRANDSDPSARALTLEEKEALLKEIKGWLEPKSPRAEGEH